ncbi:MAG: DUF4332 domain-containing protein [Anaerolineae bacterium]|nr:DUF4332 domain-containing protein [Anaerolineae bacterium]
MAFRMSELQGIGPEVVAALKGAGLDESAKLLAAVAQPEARRALAQRLNIPENVLLELGNRADLGRIKGIGPVYSDLLEFAGVDTVAELARRNPDNLFARLQEVAAHHHVRRLPTAAEVADWIAQAQQLERGIFY